MTHEEMWQIFCRKKNIDIDTPYEAWAFCDGGSVADELAKLVLERKKFGTSSSYDDEFSDDSPQEDLPKPGDYSIILWSNGEAACVIRTYEVYIRPFGDVPPFHAYAEGEGDRSLGYWRDVHTEFFAPYLAEAGTPLTDKSRIICEKFCVEYDPEDNSPEQDEVIFVEPSMTFADEIAAYKQEMLDAGSTFDGCFSIKRHETIESYVNDCTYWSNPSRPADSHGVRGSVILCIRKSDMKMVGCMQVHYVLNERMQKYTGHVGFSVRPSERRKGYATKMLAEAKDFLSTLGFREINVACLPENEASRRTIFANGGEYVETVFFKEENTDLERYRIAL